MSHRVNRGRFTQYADRWAGLWHGSALLILIIVLLAGCRASRSESPLDTSLSSVSNALVSTSTMTDTLQPLATLMVTPPLVPSEEAAGLIVFTTPPPVSSEEPLASDRRNIPSVFADIDEYHPVQATLTSADQPPPPATSPPEAALAVVQIRRCDAFGCETPAGSGVIIHLSGLILTAYHILLTDPEDPNSARYPDFVIAMTENTRTAPQPRYRARLVASKTDQDLALLAIDRTLETAALDGNALSLPALPLANVTTLFGDDLHVLGYPASGGEAISYDRVSFRSFDDSGRLIVVDRALEPGNSGGPALVVREGRFAIAGLVIRRRSTQGQLSQQGLVRAIDQLQNLIWTPSVQRVWGENVGASIQVTSETTTLQLTLTLNALDLVDKRLRLLFYATDAATGQPWQPANADAPLVVWTDVEPQQVIERRALTLTVPVASLGTTPDRLRFYVILWDRQQTLWDEAGGVQAPPPVGSLATPVTSLPTLAPTPMPTDTPTPTGTPTATPMPTHTATPTSSPSLTPTSTPTPTFTRTYIPTPGGLITYFTQDGDKKSLHVLNPDGTSTTLIKDVADVTILDVSLDRRYVALAVSGVSEIVRDGSHPRFLKSPGISLIVVSVDGHEVNVVLSEGYAFDAAYNTNGELFVAILESATDPYRIVNYAIAKTDGSELREFYSSQNYFPPTPTPTFTPIPTGRIAFDSDRDGNGEIYVMNADGSDQINLTNSPANERHPAWSPDGKLLAFHSDRDGNWEVYMMNADGSEQYNLTQNPADDYSPSWSPDGQFIAFDTYRDNNGAEIYVMNMDGTNPRRLTYSTNGLMPVWSPDGYSIAFVAPFSDHTEIYVMNADGTNPHPLKNDFQSDTDNLRPAWSPDGCCIAFESSRDGNWEIYVMNADGTDLRNLTNNSAGDGRAAWSPDGRFIAFASNRDGNEEIYVMNADGANLRRLTNNLTNDLDPAWSSQ